MWLPIPIDLKTFSFERAYELLAPFLPGGVLVFGVLLGRPDVVARIEDALVLGPYSRLAVLIVASYLSGFILFYVSAVPTITLGAILGVLVRAARWLRPSRDPRQNLASSNRQAWRRIAVKIFQADLFPEAETSEEWHDWYNALQDYLMLEDYSVPRQPYLVVSALNMGWAIIAVRVVTPVFHHWVFLVVSLMAIFILAVVAGSFDEVVYWGKEKPTYWTLTARLLRELRPKEKPSSESGPPPSGTVPAK
jgi:hypothetical protein